MVCRCPAPPFSLLRLFRSLFFPFCAAFFSFQRLPPFLFSFLLWSFPLFVFLLLSPVLAHFFEVNRTRSPAVLPHSRLIPPVARLHTTTSFTIPDVRAQTKVGDRKDKKGNTPRGSTGAQHPRGVHVLLQVERYLLGNGHQLVPKGGSSTFFFLGRTVNACLRGRVLFYYRVLWDFCRVIHANIGEKGCCKTELVTVSLNEPEWN